MYLLNPYLTKPSGYKANKFTFHYVSIKSVTCETLEDDLKTFTFHYVSIKSYSEEPVTFRLMLFTFHYVSIKSILFVKSIVIS